MSPVTPRPHHLTLLDYPSLYLLEANVPQQNFDFAGAIVILVPKPLSEGIAREVNNEDLASWAQDSVCFAKNCLRL